MKPFCEVIVSSILPKIRSMITHELLTTHGLTQRQAADLLGLTQPAISQYSRDSRGFRFKALEREKEIGKMIDDLAKEIVAEKITPRGIQTQFCNICKKVREKGIACELHERTYPSIAPCRECPEC